MDLKPPEGDMDVRPMAPRSESSSLTLAGLRDPELLESRLDEVPKCKRGELRYAAELEYAAAGLVRAVESGYVASTATDGGFATRGRFRISTVVLPRPVPWRGGKSIVRRGASGGELDLDLGAGVA
jgi:hypothetical protein